MKGRLEVFPGSAALARGAAECITTRLAAAALAGRSVSLVLSGGTTPRSVYELLASGQYRERIDWSRLQIFWGDERCVPPTSAESNYRMAYQVLLRHVPLPPHHIHRMHGELPPADGARAYERELRMALGVREGEFPRFSLVLLGLGEDGHTASLFPGTPVLEEQKRLAAELYVERLGTSRITLTFPVLNNAQTVLFLASGVAKSAILRSVLEGHCPDLPASCVAPQAGELLWYVDRDAASQLPEPESR